MQIVGAGQRDTHVCRTFEDSLPPSNSARKTAMPRKLYRPSRPACRRRSSAVAARRPGGHVHALGDLDREVSCSFNGGFHSRSGFFSSPPTTRSSRAYCAALNAGGRSCWGAPCRGPRTLARSPVRQRRRGQVMAGLPIDRVDAGAAGADRPAATTVEPAIDDEAVCNGWAGRLGKSTKSPARLPAWLRGAAQRHVMNARTRNSAHGVCSGPRARREREDTLLRAAVT